LSGSKPDSVMTRHCRARAAPTPRSTLSERPELEIASSTSPGSANISTGFANTSSNP